MLTELNSEKPQSNQPTEQSAQEKSRVNSHTYLKSLLYTLLESHLGNHVARPWKPLSSAQISDRIENAGIDIVG